MMGKWEVVRRQRPSATPWAVLQVLDDLFHAGRNIHAHASRLYLGSIGSPMGRGLKLGVGGGGKTGWGIR